MGEYWWSSGREFEPWHWILDGSFFAFAVCCSIVLLYEKTDNKWKRGVRRPILKYKRWSVVVSKGSFSASFSLLSSFLQTVNRKFGNNEWIWTRVLGCPKWPLYQLCPGGTPIGFKSVLWCNNKSWPTILNFFLPLHIQICGIDQVLNLKLQIFFFEMAFKFWKKRCHGLNANLIYLIWHQSLNKFLSRHQKVGLFILRQQSLHRLKISLFFICQIVVVNNV